MVKVTFKKCVFGYYGLKVEQHAGDALVCAGVSALGMALIGTLDRFNELKYISRNYMDGLIDVEIKIFVDDDIQKVIDTVFTTIYIGLKQIETTHPDKVEICVVL